MNPESMALDTSAAQRARIQEAFLDIVSPVIEQKGCEPVRHPILIKVVCGIESNVEEPTESAIFVNVANVADRSCVLLPVCVCCRLRTPQRVSMLEDS